MGKTEKSKMVEDKPRWLRRNNKIIKRNKCAKGADQQIDFFSVPNQLIYLLLICISESETIYINAEITNSQDYLIRNKVRIS